MSRPAVFLDRDGTLNVEREGALRDPADLELVPGAARAVTRLVRAGWLVVVVTNQSAVARGWMTLAELDAVHAELRRRLEAAGGAVHGLYFCPHHPTEGRGELRRSCDCRKPAAGMFRRAARELDIDLARSWAVGDAERDLAAAREVGVRGLLVATGKGAAQRAALLAAGREPPPFFADVGAAVEHILGVAGAPGAPDAPGGDET